MTDERGSDRTDHARHDLDVLAAAADRTADDATRRAATDQTAACRDCAELFADLRLISAELGALPRSLPVARDFRISPERAAELRPAGLRGLLQGLLGGGPSLRPFASALTTLGVAGLLLTVALPTALNGFGGASSGAALTPRDYTAAGVSAPPAPEVQGSGKSNNAGSPPTDADGRPLYPAASTTPVSLGGPAASGGPSAAPGAVDFGTNQTPASDNLGAHTPPVTAPEATMTTSLPILGILAAISLGVLLFGLGLLLASRSRRSDSAG